MKGDVPTARSSHVIVTPRGGGVAFQFAMLVAGSYALSSGWLAAIDGDLAAVFLGAFACGLLGLVEDLAGLSSRYRFIGQTVVALAVALGGLRWPMAEHLAIAGVSGQILDVVVTVFWFVWMTNLYNFMDGINGVAAVQGVVVAGFIGLLAFDSGSMVVASAMAIVAGSLLGFLPFNFPRARIFMGDTGSLCLGFLLGGLVLFASRSFAGFGIVQSALVLGMFLMDATFTLLRRLVSGERITEAHRSHSYQRLAAAWRTHVLPTLLYGSVSLLACIVVYQSRISPLSNLYAGIALTLILALIVGVQICYPEKQH